MTSATELTVTWTKSSYSGANGGDCVELGLGMPDVAPVRDSKDPSGPALTFTPAAWSAFVTAVRTGELPTV